MTFGEAVLAVAVVVVVILVLRLVRWSLEVEVLIEELGGCSGLFACLAMVLLSLTCCAVETLFGGEGPVRTEGLFVFCSDWITSACC